MQKNYDGFAQHIGFGERPAILVVDFIKGFTQPASKLASNYDAELAATLQLLQVAREQLIPIIFTTVEYDAIEQEAPIFAQKVPALKILTKDSEWVQQDERLQRQPDELIVTKKFASAFFGTNLASILVNKKVDTVIVTGCTTSGCVRATVVDALQNGFRVVVPKQCVGDRSTVQHEANLFDIENKYGDVVDAQVVWQYLSEIKGVQLDV